MVSTVEGIFCVFLSITNHDPNLRKTLLKQRAALVFMEQEVPFFIPPLVQGKTVV